MAYSLVMVRRTGCRVRETSRVRAAWLTCLLIWFGSVAFGAAAGTEVTVHATGPPAGYYAVEGDLTSLDRELAADLKALAPRLTYSARLARAADELAHHARPPGTPDLPVDFKEFVLQWAGWPSPAASSTVLYTTEDDTYDLWSHIASLHDGERGARWTHIGIGRAEAHTEPYRWVWVVLLAELAIDLGPFSATLEPGARPQLTFTLTSPLRDPTVVLSRPDGEIVRQHPSGSKGTWALQLDVGSSRGQAWMEIVAQHPVQGPQVVALFPIAIGVDRSSTWRGAVPPLSSPALSEEASERLMIELINRERERFGLSPLALDLRLAAIARHHSHDMALHDFVGHVGSDGATLGDRLRAHAYRFRRSAENVSQSPSVAEAHAGLMRSPGHRANILDASVSHVGVGVVQVTSTARPSLFVTQLFAAPLTQPQPLDCRRRLKERVRAHRERANVPAVQFPRKLTEAADTVARQAVSNLETVDLLARAREALGASGVRWSRLVVHASEVADPDTADLPDAIDDADLRQLGIGVAQPVDSSEFPTVVLLLIAPQEP